MGKNFMKVHIRPNGLKNMQFRGKIMGNFFMKVHIRPKSPADTLNDKGMSGDGVTETVGLLCLLAAAVQISKNTCHILLVCSAVCDLSRHSYL